MKLNFACLALAFAAGLSGQSGRLIQTYAGTDWTFQADGFAAVNAPIGLPTGLARDAS